MESFGLLLLATAAACTVPAPGFMDDPARDLERAGVAALEANDLEHAENLLKSALEQADHDQNCRLRVAIRRELAITAERGGRTADAERWNGEALAVARECGDLEGGFQAGTDAARIALDRGDIEAARPWIKGARQDAVELGTLTARGEYQLLQARLFEHDGALVEAEASVREAARVFDMQGPTLENLENHALARLTLASIKERREDPLAAIAELRRAATLAHDAGDRRLAATARERIAAIFVARGLLEDARIELEGAISDRLAAKDGDGASADLDRLVQLAQKAGREDRVKEYATRKARAAGAP